MARDKAGHKIFTAPNLVVLVVGLAAFGGAALALGQDANWDFKNYHLYNGYALLNGRYTRDIAPGQLQTFLNPTTDAATYLLISGFRPRVFGFVLGAIHGLNFWLSYLIARAVFSAHGAGSGIVLALLCSALGACGAGGLSEVGTTFHDTTTSTFVLAALLMFTRSRGIDASGPTPKQLVYIGSVLGLGVGLKLTLATYAVGMLAAVAYASSGWREGARGAFYWVVGACAGATITAGHWMWFLGRRFGNPLFPFYNAVFRSPYMAATNFSDFRLLPGSLRTHLLYPFLFTTEGGVAMELRFQDLRFATVYLLTGIVVLSVFASRIFRIRGLVGRAAGGSAPARSLFVFFFVSYALWQKQFGIYRYIVPLEHLAPLVIALLLSKLVNDGPKLISLCALPFAGIALSLRVPDWGRVPWGEKVVDVAVPAIAAPAKSTVVMASWEPISYAVTVFPEDVTFIRVESNMFDPSVSNKMADEIRAQLQRPGRDYYLLTMTNSVSRAPSTLAWYGFEVQDSSCKSLRSNLELDPTNSLVFCKIQRTSNAPSATGVESPRTWGNVQATPNPVPLCRAAGVSEVTVTWEAHGTEKVDLRIGSPGGPTFISGGPSGSSKTGKWVSNGTTIYLQDASRGPSEDPKRTLSRVVISAIEGPCP